MTTAATRTAAATTIATHRTTAGWPEGRTAISATEAAAAAAWSERCRVTRAFPRQKVGWVSIQASFSLGCATLIRASYLLAVLTLITHSKATTRPVNTRARATRHPAVHDSYQPIQVGSSGFVRSAACQATVLMVTVAAALTNWIVAARA